jgi:hypothetical protein
MTTIAWDGMTLASDSLADNNGLRNTTTKLHRGVLVDGVPFLLGAAGENAWSNMLHAWVKTLDLRGLQHATYPHQNNDGPDRNDPAAILILGERGVYYKGGAVWVRLEGRAFHAVGSGRDFALAAMHLGKTAEEAVELAIEFDCYSGGPIRSMELK